MHVRGVVTEDRVDGRELGRVALAGRGGMGIHVLDVGRLETRLDQRPPRRAHGADAARRRQGDVRGVGGRAIADELSERLHAPRQRVLELLEDQDSRPFGHDEPITAAIERPRRARRIVVAGRQRSHRTEPADERFEDARLGSACKHHVGIATANRLRGLADRVAAGRACRGRREIRAERTGADRDLARPDVRNPGHE